MTDLVALDLAPGPRFVTELRRAWDNGDAVLPLDQRLPDRARRQLAAMMGAGTVVATDDRRALTDGKPVEPGDALVVATSGTTGDPKGVVLTHDAVEASAAFTSAALDVDPDVDHWLCCLPVAHIGGLSVVTRALHTGTGLTVLEGFDAEAVAAAGEATLTSLVVTALRRVDPTRFRRILLGGSAIPADRPANTVATYGMTETGSGVVYDGWALDGVAMRIVDGEVQVRSPSLLRCYRDGTDPRTSDGWFPTGDGGSIDSQGKLSVTGRLADVIVTGGEKVWPIVVERALRSLAGIADVAVIGRASAEWGHEVTAVVVAAPGAAPPTLEALREAAAELLPRYALPRRLEIVEALPKTALGKVRRNDL